MASQRSTASAHRVPSLNPRWGSLTTSSRTPTAANKPAPVKKTVKKHSQPMHLSDDEIRRRIFANAAVLFPSSRSQSNAFEIVYGTLPYSSTKDLPNTSDSDENPWHYALLVRRSPTGEFTPLMRGQSWGTEKAWAMALQGLLDVTASAIHKKFGRREMPPLGINEELPTYSPATAPSFVRQLTQ